MTIGKITSGILAGVMATAGGLAGVASAQDYPDGPVTIVLGFSAGGGTDVGARGTAQFWEEALGVPIVVDNRPGAGMQVALEHVWAQPHDGQTVFWHNQMYSSVIDLTDEDVPYRTDEWVWLNIQDNDPVTITVHADSDWESLDDLVEDVRERPGEVTIGYLTGSAQMLACKTLFEEILDLDYREVPQQGGSEMRTSLAGQHVDVICSNGAGDYALGDEARTLALFNDTGSPLHPDAQSVNAYLEDHDIDESFPDLGSLRGPAVSREFAEEHPERFQILYDSYQEAIQSEGFSEWAEETGRAEITTSVSLEEAERMIAEYNEFFQRNRDVILGE